MTQKSARSDRYASRITQSERQRIDLFKSGLSYNQIALRTGCSLGSVQHALAKARQQGEDIPLRSRGRRC